MDFRLELAKIEFALQPRGVLSRLAAISLEEGTDTPSLRILAGLSERGDISDLDVYIDRTMKELHILRPSRRESAWLLIEHYIDRITRGTIDPHEGIHIIIWDVYHKMDWDRKTEKHVGDAIGIHELYGLCDTFDDLSSATGSWSDTKTNEQLLDELREQIVVAAKRYKQNYLAQRADE